MPPYVHEPTATTLLSFSDLLIDPRSSPDHTLALADSTTARSNVRNALKDVGSGTTEWLPVVDAVQAYLPQLYGLTGALDVDDLLPKGDLTFQWHSSLTSTTLSSSSALHTLPSIQSELLFTLLTYGFAMNNHARYIVDTSTTTMQVLDSAEEKKKVDRLNMAVDFLCRAAGVFEYISSTVLPAWEREVKMVADNMGEKASRKGKGKMPVECSREVVRGLALLALADAHTLAVRKLRAPFHPSVTTRALTSPLPKGHPSPGLLSKLNVHISTLYSQARSLLKTPSSGSTLAGDVFTIDGEVDSSLLDYLRREAGINEASSKKWLGIEAGESSAGDKTGLAIAWLGDAKSKLLEIQKTGNVGGKGGLKSRLKGMKSGMGTSKDAKKERKGRVEEELEEIETFLKVYKQMNDTVSFQPIPPASSLQSMVPAGRPILTAKIFVQPEAAFGPGSSGYVKLARNDEEEVESKPQAAGAVAGGYAGSGNYF